MNYIYFISYTLLCPSESKINMFLFYIQCLGYPYTMIFLLQIPQHPKFVLLIRQRINNRWRRLLLNPRQFQTHYSKNYIELYFMISLVKRILIQFEFLIDLYSFNDYSFENIIYVEL